MADRIAVGKQNRPLVAHLNTDELLEFVGKHLFERSVFYETAKLIVDVNAKNNKFKMRLKFLPLTSFAQFINQFYKLINIR